MTRWHVTAALLTVQLLFAGHYVASKWLLQQIDASAWAALRVGGGAACLLLLDRGRVRSALWPPRTLLAVAGLSLLGVVLNQILFLEGLSRTAPSHSALINTSIPVTTLMFAALLGRERITARKAVAVVLSLSGVLVLLTGADDTGGQASVRGDLLCLANATAFSLFLALSPPVMRRLSPRSVTAATFALGTLGVGAYGWPELQRLDVTALGPQTWLVGLGIVLGPTVGAYILNNWALSRTHSSRVALYIYLQFVLAAPLSWWLLGGHPSWRLLPAALLVLAGLLTVSWRERRPLDEETAPRRERSPRNTDRIET